MWQGVEGAKEEVSILNVWNTPRNQQEKSQQFVTRMAVLEREKTMDISNNIYTPFNLGEEQKCLKYRERAIHRKTAALCKYKSKVTGFRIYIKDLLMLFPVQSKDTICVSQRPLCLSHLTAKDFMPFWPLLIASKRLLL